MDSVAPLQWCSAARGVMAMSTGIAMLLSSGAVLQWAPLAGGNIPEMQLQSNKTSFFPLSDSENAQVLLPQVCSCISMGASVTWHVNKFTEIPC